MKFWERWQDGTRLKQSNRDSGSGTWTTPLPHLAQHRLALVMPEQNLCLFSGECRDGYQSVPVHSGETVMKGIIYDVHLPESWDSRLFFHLSIPQTELFQVLIQFSFIVLTGKKVPRPVCERSEYVTRGPVFKHPVNLWQHEPQLGTVVSTQILHPSTFR